MCYFFYSFWFFVWFFQPGISPTSSSSSTWLVWKGWKSWVARAAPSRSWPPPQSTSRCQTWKARTTSSKYSTSPTKSFQRSLTSRSKQVGRSLKLYLKQLRLNINLQFAKALEMTKDYLSTPLDFSDLWEWWRQHFSLILDRTHVRTYGTDIFAMDILSSISQAGGDKSMKPMVFHCVFILDLFLPDFQIGQKYDKFFIKKSPWYSFKW